MAKAKKISWDRIEPHTRSDQLEEGLQARVADPLWFLARQWQTGEFRGEDAASPIHASLEVGWNPIESFRNNLFKKGKPEPLHPGVPIEVRAESSTVLAGPGAISLAVEAGLQFLRRLSARNLTELRSSFRVAFPVDITPALLDGLPQREKNRLELLGRRAVDGQKLYAADPGQITSLGRSKEEANTLGPLWESWRQEYRNRFAEPGDSGDTWIRERLEHNFSVASASPEQEIVLSANEYLGGHLDWYSFDMDSNPKVRHGLDKTPLRRQTLELLPVPLAYAGMPNSRWWEFEEGSVYFGAIEGGPADIGRLCVAEYATIYSEDWYLLPIRLPTSSLARITKLRVYDSFGETHRILPVAYNDIQAGNIKNKITERPWAFFELAGDKSPRLDTNSLTPIQEAQIAPWLFLPPVLMGSLSGKALEEVGFLRDENANLAWAIESTIEAPTGHPLKRRHLWGLAKSADIGTIKSSGSQNKEAWTYRIQTPVPPYWIPLIPEPLNENSSEIRLRRARMLSWDDIPQEWAKGPKGQFLEPTRPLFFFEEEIPRGGIVVTRRWQLARGGDGRLYLWMARQKRSGRGERGSGLEFDKVNRRPRRNE